MASGEKGGGEMSDNRLSNLHSGVPALQYPDSNSVTVQLNQPRQPINLQDLLRYSFEASGGQLQTSNSSYLPLDEERRKFLEETLKHLTVDVIEELLKAIDILNKAGTLEIEEDPSACEDALEVITSHVDNLDTANDFHKIGGFSIFPPCLNSAHSSLRWRAAEVVAILTQNNPYCQERVLDSGLLPVLLSLLDTDPNVQVRIKAQYAVSCLVRENERALQMFSQLGGYSVLLRAMQSNIEKLQIKSAFLLSSLCSDNVIKDEICKMGFVEQLVGLVTDYHQPALEYILSALLALVTDHKTSQNECRRMELNLRNTLESLMRNIAGKEECREEYEYANSLLKIVFSGEADEER